MKNRKKGVRRAVGRVAVSSRWSKWSKGSERAGEVGWLRGKASNAREHGGKTVKAKWISLVVPRCMPERGAWGGKAGRAGEPHFDVKRGAPRPQLRSTRRYCYYEPEPFLIIEEEPEVAACDTAGCRATRMSLVRIAERQTNTTIVTCVSPISAFVTWSYKDFLAVTIYN